MKTLIALCGPAGSGKDAVFNKVIEKSDSLNKIIGSTTRPPREGEIEGVNYFYLTNQEFIDKIINRDMINYEIFREWQYGTERKAYSDDKTNIGVFNPKALMSLLQEDDFNIYIVFIEVNAKTRIMRQLNREENPDVKEIARRFLADESDFSALGVALTAPDLESKIFCLNNETNTIDESADEILEWAKVNNLL